MFLDVPVAFTESKLSDNRMGKDRHYLKGGVDIHEASIEFQKKVRDAYLWQVNEEENFKLVNCHGKEGEMLSPKVIFDKILKTLNLT